MKRAYSLELYSHTPSVGEYFTFTSCVSRIMSWDKENINRQLLKKLYLKNLPFVLFFVLNIQLL